MLKKILISGGAGFIGTKLCLSLIDKGYEITILDNLSEQIHGKDAKLPNKLKGKVKFIYGDVRNKEDWRRALKAQDVVIHLAAETGTGQSMYQIQKYTDVNINGTANMLDIITNEKNNIKKIVLASSRAVYGEGKYECSKCGIVYPLERKNNDMEKGDFSVKCPLCGSTIKLLATDEKSKIDPNSIYGITKYMQEQLIFTVGKALNLPVVVFRFQNVYGPGQSLFNPYTGILSIFSTRIKNNNNINIFEDGKESRDFVYIDDIVEATILGVEKEEANYEIFNIGSGKSIDVLTVANILKKAYCSDINIEISGMYRVGDIRANYADLTHIKRKLGFTPQISFGTGIARFIQWVECNKIEEDLFEKSIKEMQERKLFKN